MSERIPAVKLTSKYQLGGEREKYLIHSAPNGLGPGIVAPFDFSGGCSRSA